MAALKRQPAFIAEPAPSAPTFSRNGLAYRELHQRLDALRTPCFWPAVAGKPRLTSAERAGLVRLVGAIPGAAGEEEMLAAIEAMRHAPAGDVVQIGAGWGRSAALYAWLARRYGVGKTLCIDAWEGESPGDGDEALRIFEINLAPLAQGDVNYIRAASADAAMAYGPSPSVTTEAFGTTTYEGRIAVLCLSGAVAEPQAAADCALWTPRVIPAGWIMFGNCEGGAGRRVAEAFVGANLARIAARFEAGSALFVQLKR